MTGRRPPRRWTDSWALQANARLNQSPRMRVPRWLFCLFLLPVAARPAQPTAAPQEFVQEVALHLQSAASLPSGPVQLVDLHPDGSLRVFGAGKWSLRSGARWIAEPTLLSKSDAEFVFADASGKPLSVALAGAQVLQILRFGSTIHLVTASRVFSVEDGRLKSIGWDTGRPILQAALAPTGRLAIASTDGLFEQDPGGWRRVDAIDHFGRSWALANVLGVAFDSTGQLWIATKAGVGCRTSQGWIFREGRDGLPWNDFTGIAAGPRGEVWFGTHLGVIRWDGADFHYRQGFRWLPSDDVRQIVVDSQGSAWMATSAGLGCIERRQMTLQQKAELYEEELTRYIRRTPFGYLAEAPLRQAADRSSAAPDDSDNDGLWTSMYGAGECFAYGATKSPAAKARAKQAFEALRFLQVVTQGCEHSPPKGYVARTIRPIEWPDPNLGRLAGDLAEQKRDVLWKAYEPRWPKRADGKWYWKGDTSSDELDGHFFFYALYHDLVADTDGEKARVREVVRDLADHLLSHDFQLVDHDGKPTRWGVYSPRELNRNPYWWAERGLNSLSILTYMTVAAHVTGEARFSAAVRNLVEDHGYGQNLMFPKVQRGPGSGNHSDDEMAFMCYYSLIRHTDNAGLRNQTRYSFFESWSLEQPELNPFFNFAYAAVNLDQSVTNGWGTYPVSPWSGWFEDSMATLRGFPLDRLDWASKNSHRLDIVPLERVGARDLYDLRPRHERGHRVGGKVIPVENRHFNHWNTDPWDLDYPGSGRVLGSGTVFLLPYYMGLYHGYIAKP